MFFYIYGFSIAYELDPDAMLFVVTLFALAAKLSHG